jgi:hypothetical protein
MRLIIILLFCSSSVYAQSFERFKWDDGTIEIASVEMKVHDAANKVIFDGYKDGYIKITNGETSPLSHFIDIKLSGYFEIKSGLVVSFNHQIKDNKETIIYTIKDGTALAVMHMEYSDSYDHPDFIVVTGSKDYTKKPTKMISFTLCGFSLTSK